MTTLDGRIAALRSSIREVLEADVGFPFNVVLVPGTMRRPRKAPHLRCAKSHAQQE
jgi:hypothetical protein